MSRWPILLAGQNPLSHMGRNFRGEGEHHTVGQLAVLFVVLVGVGVAIWLLVRYFNLREKVFYTNPRKLFGELCRAHHLHRSERRLLRQLARAHGMSQPARLFLEPERFDTRSLPTAIQARENSIQWLLEKLFGAEMLARLTSDLAAD